MKAKDGLSKAKLLANEIGNDFLDLAKQLREIQDEAPEMFAIVAKYSDVGLRKAYALLGHRRHPRCCSDAIL